MFLWLVGANVTVWVWMDVLASSSHALLKAWCIVCSSHALLNGAWSILIETVQLSSLAVDIRDVSARDLSDAFESLVILSWAAHDLVNFVYYSFSGTSRFYILSCGGCSLSSSSCSRRTIYSCRFVYFAVVHVVIAWSTLWRCLRGPSG